MMQDSAAESTEPGPEQVSYPTAAERALATLRHRILSGIIPAGSKLNQARLAAELGMSRIPIRDAIRALAGEGLVVHDPYRTAKVAPVDLEDLAELYELRLALEPKASALAIPHLTSDDIEEMSHHLATMESLGTSADWLAVHDRFHASLYRPSGRHRIISVLEQARAQTRRYTWIRLDRDAAEIHAEHSLILAAATRGDDRSVQALMEAHLLASQSVVSERLSQASPERRDSQPTPIERARRATRR